MYKCLVIVILQLLICFSKTIFCDKHERLLYKKLLENYNVLVRPVETTLDAVNVNFGVVLLQIIDVDEQKQTIQISAWLKFAWKDYQLTWDPAEFGNIHTIHLPTDKLWKPDVLLFNSVDANFESTFPANLIISYDGSVTWTPPRILKSTCLTDIRYFPFDGQLCTFKFGSWTYDGNKLNLMNETFDLSEYLANGEWFLEEATSKRNLHHYSCCPETYIDLEFHLRIKRRSLYYTFNLIVPSLVISFMSLLGFALPVESNQKITLEMAVLLSLCLFTSIVSQAAPPTSGAIPLLGIFFICNMISVAASVILNVVIINLYYKESKAVPSWVRAVFLETLPTFLLMEKLKEPRQPNRDYADNSDKSAVLPLLTTNQESGIPSYQYTNDERRFSEPTLIRISNLLHQHKLRLDEIEDENNAKQSWKYISAVVDRLCLVFFSLVFFISIFVILFHQS